MVFEEYGKIRITRMCYRSMWRFHKTKFLLKLNCQDSSQFHKNHEIQNSRQKKITCLCIWIIHTCQTVISCIVDHIAEEDSHGILDAHHAFLGFPLKSFTSRYPERERNVPNWYGYTAWSSWKIDMPAFSVASRSDYGNELEIAINE